MQSMKAWIRDLPSTNYRIFLGIWLSVLVVLVFTLCVAIQREIQVEAVYAIFAFLGVVLGLDVTQFNIKRKTEIVTPPQVTAEHAVSPTVVAVPTKDIPPAVQVMQRVMATLPTVAENHAHDPGA